jgi:hypothetical protein
VGCAWRWQVLRNVAGAQPPNLLDRVLTLRPVPLLRLDRQLCSDLVCEGRHVVAETSWGGRDLRSCLELSWHEGRCLFQQPCCNCGGLQSIAVVTAGRPAVGSVKRPRYWCQNGLPLDARCVSSRLVSSRPRRFSLTHNHRLHLHLVSDSLHHVPAKSLTRYASPRRTALLLLLLLLASADPEASRTWTSHVSGPVAGNSSAVTLPHAIVSAAKSISHGWLAVTSAENVAARAHTQPPTRNAQSTSCRWSRNACLTRLCSCTLICCSSMSDFSAACPPPCPPADLL